jgi:heme exporter protein D
MTGIWSGVAWLRSSLPSITLIAVCILIVSSVLERRVKLESIATSQKALADTMNQFPPTGIRFEDRRAFRIPLGRLLENANHIDILGMTLLGVASTSGDFLLGKARAGCRVRFILVDPDCDALAYAVGFSPEENDVEERKRHVRTATRMLEPLINTGHAEIRHISEVPPFNLLVTDPDTHRGRVQVEIYTHNRSTIERPHFVLSPASDPYWYAFFAGQFELLWDDATPHTLADTVATT